MKSLIILGSARSDGHSRRMVDFFNQDTAYPVVDLNDLNITHFDYAHENRHDDFLPLMERILEYDALILATPVYWYTMSAQLKIFLDRLTDCLTIRKDIGRALKEKKLYVFASYGAELPLHFETPFSHTCEYMGMVYGGTFFHYSGTDPEKMKNNLIPFFVK